MTREEAHALGLDAAYELARLRRDLAAGPVEPRRIALVAAQAAMAVCEMDACRRELDEVAAAIDLVRWITRLLDGLPAAIESVRDDVAAGRWAP